jgi:hypothetical protein
MKHFFKEVWDAIPIILVMCGVSIVSFILALLIMKFVFGWSGEITIRF